MSDDDDPFEAFDAPDDEDPFEELDGPAEDAADDADELPDDRADTADDAGPGRLPDDPFDRGADADPAAGSTDPGDAPDDDPFDSFSDVPDEDDPFEAFESAGVEEIDPDAVWDSLADGADGDAEEQVFSEVSKHRFCERCEHFTGPPEVNCTYEGAAIVEFLDMETVRLLDCPIVAEQRALEGDESTLGE
ncbi:hypothetical protein [Halorientalis litorea]|uniref:hypothetical protein n=1 Tax=Halorientalis litorea TaxID=2931977 RepID=UPI001FF5B219|nr:hypothetical protein [Halorientalis litorea]